jgi:hypothetical protein
VAPPATTLEQQQQDPSDGGEQWSDGITEPKHKRGPRRKKPRLIGPSFPPPSVKSEESSLDIRDDKGVVSDRGFGQQLKYELEGSSSFSGSPPKKFSLSSISGQHHPRVVLLTVTAPTLHTVEFHCMTGGMRLYCVSCVCACAIQKDEDSTNYSDWLPPESKVFAAIVGYSC